MRRPKPVPPRPDIKRRPTASFGWLDTRLLHDGVLASLGPGPSAVLLLLALAADDQGVSYYGRGKMSAMLGMDMESVTQALQSLLDIELVAFRPWRPGSQDGVWQLLPVNHTDSKHYRDCLSVTAILNQLGMGPRDVEG